MFCLSFQSGAFKLTREGYVLLQFAPAASVRVYDWGRKQVSVIFAHVVFFFFYSFCSGKSQYDCELFKIESGVCIISPSFELSSQFDSEKVSFFLVFFYISG